MGLFSTRKGSSRETAAASQGGSHIASAAPVANSRLPQLSTLFTESREVTQRKSTPIPDGNNAPIPTVNMHELGVNVLPTDTVTPIAANQFEDDDRAIAPQKRKTTMRLQHTVSNTKSQQASGLQEIAVQRAESLSRVARRNSIKRSVSRKIAKSESRRQLLNIKDGSLGEDKGNSGLVRRMTSTTSSNDVERRDSVPGELSRTMSAQNERKQVTRASLSPVSGVVAGSLEARLKSLDISEGDQKDKEEESESTEQSLNLAIEEEGLTSLQDDVDDDIDMSHASLRNFGISANQANLKPEAALKEAGPVLTSQEKARRTTATSRERKDGKQRKRPPPLLGSDDSKSAPNSAMDWPSGSCFGSDGGFMTGGFKITTEGMVGKPLGVKREDSDSELDGGVPQSSRNLIIVKSLKEFRAGPTIGAGAGGRVYLAQHLPSKKTMAMKVVNVYDKEKRNQLLKELETLSTHVSRYLVRFYGAFYDGSGAVHIALEYMDHGCLSTFVHRAGAIPEKIMQMIVVDCLKGLKFLHRHHVLHRDFKTANILLSRKLCCAKLSDFGLARDLNPGVSKVDTFVGTVAYMSPERLQGSKYTYASDIWALGVCTVECLLGRYPFDRPQNYFDYIEATMTANMLSGFDQKGARFSPEVRDFVALCTMADPMRRPASNQLLQHSWLKDVKRDTATFGAWLDECRILSMLPGAAAGR